MTYRYRAAAAERVGAGRNLGPPDGPKLLTPALKGRVMWPELAVIKNVVSQRPQPALPRKESFRQ